MRRCELRGYGVVAQVITFFVLIAVLSAVLPLAAQNYRSVYKVNWSHGSYDPERTWNRYSAIARIADFNNDGKPDLVVLVDGTARVALAAGVGTFEPWYSVAPAVHVSNLLTGDFNKDGNVDLVMVRDIESGRWKELALYSGDGTGQFQYSTSAAIGVPHDPVTGVAYDVPLVEDAVAMSADDLNHDGDVDLVIDVRYTTSAAIHFCPGSMMGRLTSFLNDGAGNFAATGVIDNCGSYYNSFASLVIGDLDVDGNSDVLIAGYAEFLGNGDGTFQPYAVLPADQFPNDTSRPVVITDLNGDGSEDAVYISGAGLVSLLNNGHGTFKVRTIATPGLFGTATADFDGDGKVDVIVGAQNSFTSEDNVDASPMGALWFHRGNGDGSFQEAVLLDTPTDAGGNSGALLPFDLNGDTLPDLISVGRMARSVDVLLSTRSVSAKTLSPTPFVFGEKSVNSVGSQQLLTITNSGTAPLSVTRVELSSSNFTQINSCDLPVPVGASCTVSIAFIPSAEGKQTAYLSLTDDSSNSHTAVVVVGIGVPPAVTFSPAELSFPLQKVGTASDALTLTVTNASSETRNLSLNISGDYVSSDDCGTHVDAQRKCHVAVRFRPLASGSDNGRLIISSQQGDLVVVPLLGTGYVNGPMLTISPTTITFDKQFASTSSAPKTVTVTNSGDVPVTITSVTTSGADFTALSTCGNQLAPGLNCAVGVFFSPQSAGSSTGRLQVVASDSEIAHVVELQGTGTNITITAAVGSTTSAIVAAGQSATYKLDISPQGGYSGTVNLECNGVPVSMTCVISPATLALDGINPAAVTITVSTSGAGATIGAVRSGSLFALVFFAAGTLLVSRKRCALLLVIACTAIFVSCGGPKTTPTPAAAQTASTYVMSVVAGVPNGKAVTVPLVLTVQK